MPALYQNVSLGGVLLTPSGKEKTLRKIGRLRENANGGREWIQRVDGDGEPIVKRDWSLSFDGVLEANRAAVEALFLADTTAPFRDENGETFTVQCEADEYSDSFSFRDQAGNMYYSVDLKLHQV